MIYEGIDTAARINAKAAKTLADSDITFVCRYLVPNSGSTAWKALTAEEANELLDAGLAILPCWETTAKRMQGGYDAGHADGQTAKELAEEMGIPSGTVIYFAADYAVPESDYSKIYSYLYAASSAVHPYLVGLYGSQNVVDAMDVRKACAHFWQCVGGSNKFLPCAKVIQHEGQNGTNAKAMAEKVGFAVDLDSAETLDGMWRPEEPASEEETAMKWAKENGIVTDDMRDVSQTALMLWRYHNLYGE